MGEIIFHRDICKNKATYLSWPVFNNNICQRKHDFLERFSRFFRESEREREIRERSEDGYTVVIKGWTWSTTLLR